MSLLGSIFGDSSKKDEKDGLSGIFDKSADLPEKPHHVPVARPVKRKEVTEGSGEDDEANNKKRKKRKSKNKDGEEENSKGESAEKESNAAAKKDGNEHPEQENGDIEDAQKAKSPNEKAQDDESERTIFVGNLPLATTTRKSLATFFKDCGPIASARIRSVPVKGIKLPPARAGDQNFMKKVCANTKEVDESLKNTVQGYVVFKNIDSVAKALEKNNETTGGGLRLRVDKASPTVEPSRSVFCGNLPYGADEASLRNHFIKGCALDVGDVEGVRIIRDKDTFLCKGFGYVLFREKSTIPLALKLHETTYMRKKIRVLVCGKRFKGKKGENKPKYKEQAQEKVTIGAFRRMLAKQTKESVQINKRKRGEKKKTPVAKKPSGLSKRAALEKKVDQRVKKLQKRASKGMGKTRR